MFYMDEKISRDMIFTGLLNGVIRIINNPNDGEVAAEIADNWFYFAGGNDVDMSAEAYLDIHSFDEIADMIYDVINDEPINGETEVEAGEWLYYRAVLIATMQSF